MKKLIATFLLSVSLVVAAAVAIPVGQTELSNVNTTLSILIPTSAIKVEITSATRDAETNLLTSLNSEATYTDETDGQVSVNLGMTAENAKINLLIGAKISGDVFFNKVFQNAQTDADIRKQLEEVALDLEKDAKKNSYTLSFQVNKIADLNYSANFVLKPTSPEAVSIESLSGTATIDATKKIGTFAITATVKSTSTLVDVAQKSMSAIFADLALGNEPNEESFEQLMSVFEETLRNF